MRLTQSPGVETTNQESELNTQTHTHPIDTLLSILSVPKDPSMELNDCNCITEFRDCLHIVQVVPWKIPSVISAKYYKIKSKKWICLFQLSFLICHLNCLCMLSLMKIISECMRILVFLCITDFDKTQTLTPVDTSAKLHHTLFLIIFYSCIFGPATHSYVPLLYALFSIFSCVFGPATHAVF